MGRKPIIERKVVIPREELQQYLIDNHRLFTISEMAATSGYAYNQIKVACDNAGLRPISIGERVKEYLECNMHLTLQEQADRLEMKIDALKYYYKQFGFDLKKAGKGIRVIPSSRNNRERVSKIIRELGNMPLELALGPIAKKYNIDANPMDTINETRMRILAS